MHILFVLAGPKADGVAVLARILGRHLDPFEYRMEALAFLQAAETGGVACGPPDIPGIEIDAGPLGLSTGQAVDYLAHKLPAYDAVVIDGNAAPIHSALERLHWRPPLIEFDKAPAASAHGLKNFVSPPLPDEHTIALRWKALFRSALKERKAAPPPSVFASFVQGGFECSTHRRQDERRLDLLAATGHDVNTSADYRQLRGYGIATVRDGLRWHLIETANGRYDWSSFLPMLRSARETETQVVWDLMHYGWPDHLDIWTPHFVRHFARFAGNVARLVRSETDAVPFYCPINEISYLAWGGGDSAYLNPFALGRSFELKAQLARAAIAAMEEILRIEPRARFVHCEPAIHIVADAPEQRLEAERARQAQFQALDMISGTLWPQLGGEPRLLDIVGVNYYRQNQWRLAGPSIDRDDRRYRPFRALLAETHARYGRPLLVAETGTEGDERAAWFTSIMREVAAARQAGVPVEGVCLYPIIDHVGWDNDRDCPSGLLANRFENGRRAAHAPLADVIMRYCESGFDAGFSA